MREDSGGSLRDQADPYRGGAGSALHDEHVMERVHNAIEAARSAGIKES